MLNNSFKVKMLLLCFNRGKFGSDVVPIVAAVIVVLSGCGLSSVISEVFIDDEGFSKVSVVVVDDDVVVAVVVVAVVVIVIICDDDSFVAIVVVEVAGVIGVVVVVVVDAAEDVVVALDIVADNFEFKSLE